MEIDRSKVVSRVGALAFGLGLGVAVATAGDLAVASAAPDSSTDAASDTGANGPAKSPADESPKDPVATAQVTRSGSNTTTRQLDSVPKDDESPAKASVSAKPTASKTRRGSSGFRLNAIVSAIPSAAAKSAAAGQDDIDGSPLRLDTRSSVIALPALARAMTANLAAADSVPVSVVAATPPMTYAAPTSTPARVVPRLVSLAHTQLNPFLNDDPTTPDDTPPLLGIIDAVRRDLKRLFRNELPTADVSQTAVSPQSGVTLGTLNAVDPEGDRMKFAVTEQPKFGTVELDADGGYVYRLNGSLPPDGLKDSFTVSIQDRGVNLRRVLGLIGLAPTSRSVLVGVDVLPPPPLPPQTGSDVTRRFTVTNLTGYTLRLDRYQDGGTNNMEGGGPPIGSLVAPGESHYFDVIYHFAESSFATPLYVPEGQVGTEPIWFTASMKVTPTSAQSAFCRSGGASCTPYGDTAGAADIVFLNNPGTTVTIDANNNAQQNLILDKLCTTDSRATCTFRPTSQNNKDFWTTEKFFDAVSNDSDEKQEFTFTLTDTTTSTDSINVGAKAGFKIAEIISAEINASYGHVWTQTQTFTRQFKLSIPAHSTITLSTIHPVTRYTGDFTLKMGNTTFLIKNVVFDQPDESGGRPSQWKIGSPKPSA